MSPTGMAAAPGNVAMTAQLLRKTRLCKFFVARGQCARGHACGFAHGAGDLRLAPDFSFTKQCRTFAATGRCEQAACSFAHDLSELRPWMDPDPQKYNKHVDNEGPDVAQKVHELIAKDAPALNPQKYNKHGDNMGPDVALKIHELIAKDTRALDPQKYNKHVDNVGPGVAQKIHELIPKDTPALNPQKYNKHGDNMGPDVTLKIHELIPKDTRALDLQKYNKHVDNVGPDVALKMHELIAKDMVQDLEPSHSPRSPMYAGHSNTNVGVPFVLEAPWGVARLPTPAWARSLGGSVSTLGPR